MRVYLVEDAEISPGRILKIYANEKDAKKLASFLPQATRVISYKVMVDFDDIDVKLAME